jgi:hypothetical protein
MMMTDRKKTERFLIQGWYQNQRKVDAKINTRLVKKIDNKNGFTVLKPMQKWNKTNTIHDKQ